MNLRELHPFRLRDAVEFHDTLNPKLWWGDRLQPRVRRALLKIARDFIEYLGIDKLNIKDITISGSNAAYSYTDHSDIDLHLVVDMDNLNPDSVYRELFRNKKELYNAGRKITVHGIPVECYVQDNKQEHVTLGEYSIQDGKWLKYPTKSRSHYNEVATRHKYNKLRGIIERAIATHDSELIDALLKKLKQYRSAGLERGGEFSPENLSYKAVKAQGTIDKLYKMRDRLRGRDLSIEGQHVAERSTRHRTPTVEELAHKHGVSVERVNRELKRGIAVELEHTASRTAAARIARDHLGERLDYYSVLKRVGLEENKRSSFPRPPTLEVVRESKMKKWWHWRDNLSSYLAEYDLNKWESRIAGSVMDGLLGKNKITENTENDPLESFLKQIQSLSAERNSIKPGDIIGILRVSTIRQFKILKLEVLPRSKVLSLNDTELLYTSDGVTTRAIDLEPLNDATLERGVHLITEPSMLDRIYTDVYWYETRLEAAGWEIDVSETLFENLEDRARSIREASGYIPSKSERHDPRWSSALSADVGPDAIQQNARALGMRVTRDGRPPLLMRRK